MEKPYKSKKEYLSKTSYYLSEEECEIFVKFYGKDTECRVTNVWKYCMGRIGCCNRYFVSKNGKEKDFNKHPSWRPLAVCHYRWRDYKDNFQEEVIYAQSWDEIRENCSDTENMTWRLYKHPHQ